MRIWLVIFLSLCYGNLRASHAMGGEITYTCVGGNSFVFELIFYRDCNGAEVNTMSESIRVWNHPTVTSITLPFVGRDDISPFCSPVAGGPVALNCGVGAAGGNGIGAIQRVRYRSAPITLNGTPPSQGWIFTFENFSRNGAITNLVNPSAYGITLAAKMYAIPGGNGSTCLDSSPTFLQEPNFVSCSGTSYQYNMNAIDPNLDSLHFSFGVPYNYFPSANYDPPNTPNPIPFETGFTFESPTPGTSLNPGNEPATLNPVTGELKFKSFTSGNFVVKIVVQSFRQGVLISEVEREMQLVVTPCNPANNAPIIQAPFPGNSFETTVTAGDLVNFNLVVNDSDLLQNNTPQSVYLTASGPMFGIGFTNPNGCDILPCATLNAPLPISGSPSATATFNWQTGCNHLVNQFGIVGDMIPYNFVFKVQDNYCQVPRVTYATVKINVVNPGVIPPTKITCIETAPNGDLTIKWNTVNDPSTSFVAYELYSVQNGLLATINSLSTDNYTLTGVNNQRDFYVGVRSGCNGNVLKSSDTISNIRLAVNNPGNGTAVLQWNKPHTPQLPGYGNNYKVYREYPTGTWTLRGTAPYGTPYYKDTIDICQAFLNYRVELETNTCTFTSNVAGDDFEDMITPNIPIIYSVGADTVTDQVLITWNINPQADTYGYVIYTFDENGFLYELDTVWGRDNTFYIHNIYSGDGPFSYSIAAFDSCLTDAVPITYQTSAKGNINTSMVATSSVFMCEKKAVISWSAYSGRTVSSYEIWAKTNGYWELLKISNLLEDTIDVNSAQSYRIYVKAIFNDGRSAFSSPTFFTVPLPSSPAYHYFSVASIEDGKVRLEDYIDASVGISKIIFYRKDKNIFKEIGREQVTNNFTVFYDTKVDLRYGPIEYRTQFIDSCGEYGDFAENTNKTIFVTGSADEYNLINTIEWTPYELFDGTIQAYDIYRGLDGEFEATPFVTVTNSTLGWTDDVGNFNTNGKVCYRVEAVETVNSFGFGERARSNDFCLIYKPLVFVPNAFTPGGSNPIFKPVLTNVSTEKYEFTVYNRWGQVIFITNDVNEGWNGKLQNGMDATSDMFTYTVEFADQSKKKFKRNGYVALLR